MFPAPQPLDIIMDLVATTQPFLGGQAHAGMVWGTRLVNGHFAFLYKSYLLPLLGPMVYKISRGSKEVEK